MKDIGKINKSKKGKRLNKACKKSNLQNKKPLQKALT